MVSLGSCLNFSQEACSLKSYACLGQTKTFGIRRRISLRSSLSSCTVRQDHWNIYVTDKICRPLHRVSLGKKVFTCRSFMSPGSMNGSALMKSTTMALSRSFNALRESPMLAQTIPAIALVAFALWGLGPLMRHSRNFFLQGNDANWKKSKTYFVCTSYLQPLLLWTGSILICRVLDQVVLHSEASQIVKQRLLNFVKSLSSVLAFAYCLSSLIQQMQKFVMEANEFSDARNMGFQFASKAVYTAVWVAAVSLFMELLGFSTQKWLTAGGLGTVLLTLAGREIFTNFLSSIMIHATRPFVLNEWIQTKIEGYEVSGTVEHVGWWSPTIIRGDDREAVHIPNHKFTVNVVRNLSQKTHWRVKTYFAISHLDANKISNIVADMRKVLSKNSQVEQQRLHRRVFLEYIEPENQAFMILISCFVKTSHFEEYLCVKEGILLDLLRVISHHRARLATPIRTVQKIYGDADLENVPFAETIITRGGTPVNRPLYLIDTTLRINGDDKAKPRPTSRANEEQSYKSPLTSDQKTTALSSDDSSSDKQQQQKIEDHEETLSMSDGSVQNDFQSENLQQKVKSPLSTNSSTRSQPEAVNNVGLISKDIKGAASQSTSQSESGTERSGGLSPGVMQSRHESEKVPITPSPVLRTSLEENIVLGVALDGSKRTLPIDEGISQSSSVETKELAALRNGNGSSSAVKMDMQTPAAPGGTSSEQRDQEK